MEYTKGEWRVEDRWNVLSGRRLVANCGGHHSNVEPVAEENEANAQLISSAPDLYEACNAGLRFLVDIHDLLMKHLEYIERAKELNNLLWQAHDKAIAKVEGG